MSSSPSVAREVRGARRRRLAALRLAAALGIGTVVWAAWAAGAGGQVLEAGGAGWIEQRRAALPAPARPNAAAARFELAEEIAALRGELSLVPLAASDRRAMFELLAEAIELDESWTSPSLRLAWHAEDDPRRRARLERMRRGVAGGGASRVDSPTDRLEESRFLARYRGGRIEVAATGAPIEIEELLANPWLEAAIDGGGERIRRDLATGTVPLLRPEERRGLLEFDRARLAPEVATFAGSEWIDGWAPLPEVDARSLAGWLRSLGR